MYRTLIIYILILPPSSIVCFGASIACFGASIACFETPEQCESYQVHTWVVRVCIQLQNPCVCCWMFFLQNTAHTPPPCRVAPRSPHQSMQLCLNGTPLPCRATLQREPRAHLNVAHNALYRYTSVFAFCIGFCIDYSYIIDSILYN